MDAAEVEGDVKLYKASGELLSELKGKLPLLLENVSGELRKCVLTPKTSEISKLLDAFQEWPQLLDPVLAEFVQRLVKAFLHYCVSYRSEYEQFCATSSPFVEPLPRAICHLLYVFCKVRGHKVISRLLSNEAKYIEPLLSSFRTWQGIKAGPRSLMTWQERYILFLWLSHLMLAPFELSSISTLFETTSTLPEPLDDPDLPPVAKNLLSLALPSAVVPSKDREAANMLISRLALRRDMQRLNMPRRIAQWCLDRLNMVDIDRDDQYTSIGYLTLLSRLVNSASHAEVILFNHQVFSGCYLLASGNIPRAERIRSAAPARKLAVKIFRTCIQHAVAAEKTTMSPGTKVDVMLEEGVQILLEWLADTDTPVRQAASKSLSIVARVIEPQMSAEVIEAVLACLEENMLIEDRRTGNILPAAHIIKAAGLQYKKNVSAVDALKWQGVMLTLGHLLFRRSAPVALLPTVIEALLMGLRFEQRSNVGTSLGVGVRDAACFGIWSLARKYTTSELNQLSVSAEVVAMPMRAAQHDISTLQHLASELVVSACLDPSGNLRRGASAALQELIGRHPDTVAAGISVVQIVDYHSVARRSRALVKISWAASELSETYHLSLLHALLEWRALRATDAESRAQAAQAVGKLFSGLSKDNRLSFGEELVAQIRRLKSTNTGSNAAARHGLLLALASIITTCKQDLEPVVIATLTPPIFDIDVAVGTLETRVTKDLVNVLEAAAYVIEAVASCPLILHTPKPQQLWPSSVLPILYRCTTASEEDRLCSISAKANLAVYNLLSENEQEEFLEEWIAKIPSKKTELVSGGRLLSLGFLYSGSRQTKSPRNWCWKIISFLNGVIESDLPIETRVSAMMGLVVVARHSKDAGEAEIQTLQTAIVSGLTDYTTDQRGDVGSWLRLESLQAARHISKPWTDQKLQHLCKNVVRLAADKMTKVRFEAWKLLESHWSEISNQALNYQCQHQTDTTSFSYYRQIAELLVVPWLHDAVLYGLVGSIAGTGDDIGRSSAEALTAFLAIQVEREEFAGVIDVCRFLCKHLVDIASQEDKDVIPVLELTAFVLGQYRSILVMSKTPSPEACSILFSTLGTGGASMQRTEAIIRLAGVISTLPHVRDLGLDQLTRKLLHKWPKVRNTAADMISMDCCIDEYLLINWDAPAISNRSEVVEMRRKLGLGKGIKA